MSLVFVCQDMTLNCSYFLLCRKISFSGLPCRISRFDLFLELFSTSTSLTPLISFSPCSSITQVTRSLHLDFSWILFSLKISPFLRIYPQAVFCSEFFSAFLSYKPLLKICWKPWTLSEELRIKKTDSQILHLVSPCWENSPTLKLQYSICVDWPKSAFLFPVFVQYCRHVLN